MKNAVIVIVRRGTKILIGKRTKEYGKGQYQLVGGLVESNENPLQAARRELNEETGLDSKEFKYITNIFRSDDKTGESYFSWIYETTSVVGNLVNREPDKCEGWDWHDITNLPQPLFEIDGLIEDYIWYVEEKNK